MYRRYICLLMAVFLCYCIPGSLSASPLDVQIQFDRSRLAPDGSPDWIPLSGRWRIIEGEYVQLEYGHSAAYTFLRQPVVSDFEWTVRFKPERIGRGSKAAGLVFRAVDSGNFYYVQISSKNRQVILVRATPRNEWIEITRTRNLDIAPGTWHEAKVTAQGPRIRVFLDRREVIDAEDDTLTAGAFGLRVGQGRVRFADMRIVGEPASIGRKWQVVKTDWTPEPKILLQGGQHIVAASGEVGTGMFPKLVQLPGGELVALIRGGAPHAYNPGGRLDLIRSTDGGLTWSKPRPVITSPQDDRGASLGVTGTGRLLCIFRRCFSPQRQVPMVSMSDDGGETWSEPVELKFPPYEIVAPFQRIIQIGDGTLLMPAYGGYLPYGYHESKPPEKQGVWAWVIRSTDNGQTWGDLSVIGRDFSETALLELPSGRILAACRSDHLESRGTWITYSDDKGRTWSKPEQILRGRRYPCDMVLLPSGHILLVYGHRHPPYGVECMISKDGGKTWSQNHKVMLGWTASDDDSGYPSSVVLYDGTIVTLYYQRGDVKREDLGYSCMCVRCTEEDIVRSEG